MQGLEESLKAFSEVYEENKRNLKILSREVELVESSVECLLVGFRVDRKENVTRRLEALEKSMMDIPESWKTHDDLGDRMESLTALERVRYLLLRNFNVYTGVRT